MAKRRKVGNLLALAILALLVPGQSMHPYEMANMLRRTGKERDMQIKWGSFYTVVQNLEKYGFLAATSSAREGRRPERTLYAITDAGREELKDWLRELIADPEPEFPRFEAALSVVGVLPPDELIPLLETRIRALDESIAADRADLAAVGKTVPRVFLIEGEYALALREAEVAWVRGLLREIVDGTLDGVAAWREFHATGDMPEEYRQMLMGEGPANAGPANAGPANAGPANAAPANADPANADPTNAEQSAAPKTSEPTRSRSTRSRSTRSKTGRSKAEESTGGDAPTVDQM